MNRRNALFWAALGVVLVLLGTLAGGRSASGPPLSPESTDPLGTRALMIFLEESGAEPVRDLPDDSIDTALLLVDRLEPSQRLDLAGWVEAGGTLVVTDPSSPFAPDELFPPTDTGGAAVAGTCTVAEADGLVGLRLEAPSFVRYQTDGRIAPTLDDIGPGDDTEDSADRADPDPQAGRGSLVEWGAPLDAGCFGDGDRAYLVSAGVGRGRIVALGGALPLTNENLDEADNAVLAARLLVGDEPGPVAVVAEAILAPGTRTFSDLVPSAAKWAGWQLLVVFALVALWRAVRFGRPVPEPQPVELPGSLLVRASAELHRRSGGRHRAAKTVRADLERRLRRRLRVSPDRGRADVVDLLVERHGADRASAQRALADPAVVDEELGRLLADVDLIDAAVDAEPGRPDHSPTLRSASAGEPT